MTDIRRGGYYWVKFDYPRWGGGNRPEHWEIGSWDPVTNVWMLIGSADIWLDFQVKEVGAKIEERT
jgi:hypothetical protein